MPETTPGHFTPCLSIFKSPRLFSQGFLGTFSPSLRRQCERYLSPYSSAKSFFRVTSVAIVGAHRFYDTIVNFLGLIGYWSAAYVGIASVEHLLFRKNNFDNYDQAAWDRAKSLPSGLSALAALIASFGLVIPSMHQVWYVGPIAQYTGDIGFEVAFALASILYVPLRWFELRWKAKRLDN